jgi:hypothetical protein
MAFNKDQNESVLPISGNVEKRSSDFLPKYFRTLANQKFLNATLDQMISEGEVEKISAFIGRKKVESYTSSDNYLDSSTQQRNSYQLEPAVVIQDNLGNVNFFKDYIDFVNQIDFFKGITDDHSLINSQEYYAWNPHIDWDKFVNYREYYWLPYGPPSIPVSGQADNIVSTYTVRTVDELDNVAYLFTPDGLTRNPRLRLYRGQTYRFEIDCPGHPIAFKTVRETGNSFFYTDGVSTGNQYVEKGVIEFEIPENAPNIIYYVSKNDINTSGFFKIYDITAASKIDVVKEILGKKTYSTADGVALSNGMKIFFQGRVSPEEYSQGNWYVEGVGSAIKLIKETDLITPAPYSSNTDIEFDNENFDSQGFDVSNDLPSSKDYILINRSSKDRNPWSRYNRWFHKDVIDLSYQQLNLPTVLDQSARATRPIIEFQADINLWNFGRLAKKSVTLVDTFTEDVFSTIEGSRGYNVDGIDLIEGMRVLFTADTDQRVVGRIFKVAFVTHLGVRRITLVEEPDAVPTEDDVVLVQDGLVYKGTMFSFKQDRWQLSQQKTDINQPPLFDVFDSQGVSYGDLSKYEGTTFRGTKIFSYAPGSIVDKDLGFGISYRNIGNIGDIVFDFNLLKDTFIFKQIADVKTSSLDQGFLKKTDVANGVYYVNGWETAHKFSDQYVVSQFDGTERTNFFPVDVYDNATEIADDIDVKVYVNGRKLDSITEFDVSVRSNRVFVELVKDIEQKDSVVIRTKSDAKKNDNGFYEIPSNLESNPNNDNLKDLTLGEVINHVKSMTEDRTDVIGIVPGPTNLRDLGDLTKYGSKIVQHSSPLIPAIYHFTSKEHNIVNALRFSREEYNKFKRNFLRVSSTLGFDGETRIHFDLVMKELVKDKNDRGPFYFTDMVPYSGEFIFQQTVIDDSIVEYPLTFNFDLDSASDKAVLIYLNEQQLIHNKDYVFIDSNFVRILARLQEGDDLKIVQYESTDGCYVPATPSKLGLYPLYEPRIFLDDTYVEPVLMIQGHDGSLVKAFGDFRDQLILELELRIFNNCKIKYDVNLLDINDYISTFYRKTDVSRQDLNSVLRQDFLKWTRFVADDFTKHTFYERENSFTYNYSRFSDIDQNPVPGYWRAIYKYYFDTDRPHQCPWEMLGFSIKPQWWERVYGPAPYTKDNLVLWNDLAEGIIREPGKLTVRNPKYARPRLLNHIPVDELGNLLSPLQSNSVDNFVANFAEEEFEFGDSSPIESAWRKSSEYPFALITALTILRPARIFAVAFDRIRQVRNSAGQIVYKTASSEKRFSQRFVEFPTAIGDTTRNITSGLVNYIADYSVNQSQESYKDYKAQLSGTDVKLSFRVGGFVSKDKFKMVLDSRNPLNKGNVFIPFENYSVILNTSSPVLSIDYSGVIVEKQPDGFVIRGYNQITPEFKYFKHINIVNDPVVNIGGISEPLLDWAREKFYNKGQVVRFDNNFYRVTTSHTSSDSLELKFFAKLPALPVEGGRNIIVRSTFESDETTLAYGTKIETIQGVVDFILGYGEWLTSQGFDFEYFNPELETVTDWLTAAKEFAFWTTQNWSAGSVISLSPSADELIFRKDFSVVDNVFDNFYEYSILKQDGAALDSLFVNTIRKGQQFVMRPRETADGIYHVTLNLVQKEHIVILDDKTVFNDTIFDKTQGYRQERIKVVGYRTGGWQGDFNIPGFIYDRALVTEWMPWKDYALADTVKYKEFYYSAKTNVPGTELFDPSSWYRLNERPESSLIPNWDYKANQFADFYDLDTDSFDVEQQKFAQHLIGYQRRPYLENIINDDVAQYKFYQGMIRDKGTKNVFSKLFDPLSAKDKESLEFYEEWAIRVGQYGAVDAFEEVEYRLDEGRMLLNPQPFELVDFIDQAQVDFVYRIPRSEVYLAPENYQHQPLPVKDPEDYFVQTAGYVRPDDIDFIVKTKDDLKNFSLRDLREGKTFWVGFDRTSWNVYRFTQFISSVVSYESLDEQLKITLPRNVDSDISVGDYIGINSSYNKLDGIYRVAATTFNSITVDIEDFDSDDAVLATNASNILYKFVSLRLESRDNISTIDDIGDLRFSNRRIGDRAWIDGEDGKWSVWQYNKVYSFQEIIDEADNFGNAVCVNDSNTTLAVTADNRILYFFRPAANFNWSFVDQITPGSTGVTNTNGSFGEQLAISRDGNLLLVSAPRANNTQGYVALYRKNSAGLYFFERLLLSDAPQPEQQFGHRITLSASNIFVTSMTPATMWKFDLDGDLVDKISLGNSTEVNTISISNDALALALDNGTVSIYDLDLELLGTVENSSLTTQGFAASAALSRNGKYLAVGVDKFENQGAVALYKNVDSEYQFQYLLKSPYSQESQGFGEFVKFTIAGDQLAVYAPNVEQLEYTIFDSERTVFDKEATNFVFRDQFVGNVFVFDRYNEKFVYADELPLSGNLGKDYGSSLFVTDKFYIGDPITEKGGVYEFTANGRTWTQARTADKIVDLSKIKTVFLYDTERNSIIEYLDTVDVLQGKILGIAEQEISYKTPYDPATYNIGTVDVNVDGQNSWTREPVGKIWWDISATKFVEAHQGSVLFKTNTWNSTFADSEVEIYEWVSSRFRPSEWDELADTEEGLALGISGQSKYGDLAYSLEQTFDVVSESVVNTFYFWVRNKTTVPNSAERTISARDVADYIRDPKSKGIRYIALLANNQFALVNCKDLIADRNVALNIRYYTAEVQDKNIHSHYELIAEGDTSRPLNRYIEKKWIDSLVGVDEFDNPVPDPTLPVKLKYGVLNKPRQSMFVNRIEAVKQFVEGVNDILIKNNIVDFYDISGLFSKDNPPGLSTNRYDEVKQTASELRFVNSAGYKKPEFSAVVENGEIVRVIIINRGRGYNDPSYSSDVSSVRKGPNLTVSGTGVGARISTTINQLGEIVGVKIENRGKGYQPGTSVTARPLTVLVNTDENSNGKWVLYEWMPETRTWRKGLIQVYDTTKYWSYADWYAEGANQFTKVNHRIDFVYQLAEITVEIGETAKIRNSGSAGWLLIEKIKETDDPLDVNNGYRVIGRGNGTIQLNENIYRFAGNNIGFDGPFYDTDVFDDEAKEEFRIIIDQLRNKILIDNLSVDYNKLFFSSLRYVFSEQIFVDWAFKTSFIYSKHNLGELKKKVNYQSDSLDSYEQYVQEVKPYRSKVREFVSAYDKLENTRTMVDDFDLPPIYDNDTGKIVPFITKVSEGVVEVNNNLVLEEPYSSWFYNLGHSVKTILVREPGTGYETAPIVQILGSSRLPARATAYVSRGKLINIVVDDPGEGYVGIPTVQLIGGLKTDGTPAQLSIELERGPVRSNLIGIKFDRISKVYELSDVAVSQQFEGTGSKTRFELKWPADLKPRSYSITVDGQELLDSDFTIANILYTNSTYDRYQARVIFNTAPALNANIIIRYTKDINLLSAADRINFFYEPQAGQLGKDLGQLMQGVDYGGVELQGLDFSIGSGWDAIPWFTGGWDSFDTQFKDFLSVSDGISRQIELPYVPEQGVEINIYKNSVRIDDPTYSIKTAANNLLAEETAVLDALISALAVLEGELVDLEQQKAAKLQELADAQALLTQLESELGAIEPPGPSNPVWAAKAAERDAQVVVVLDLQNQLQAILAAINETTIEIESKQQEIEDQALVVAAAQAATDAIPPIGNANAEMDTVYGDGESNIIQLGEDVVLSDGDQIFIRESTSDGSFRPDDRILDVEITGGDLAYQSAKGVRPEEISIDGDGFVTPISSAAPEEVVPGQLVDSVDIQVFHKVSDGAPTIVTKHAIIGEDTRFDIGQVPNTVDAVIVKVNDEIQTIVDDYLIDARNLQVILNRPYLPTDEITIISMSQNGRKILDLDSFIADGETNDYVTAARPVSEEFSLFVTVNGAPTGVSGFIADDTFSTPGNVVIRFSSAPSSGSLIAFTVIDGFTDTISKVSKQEIVHDGVNDTYPLSNPPAVSEPLENNLIVVSQGKVLKSVDNFYFDVAGQSRTYNISSTRYPFNSIGPNELNVYVNGATTLQGRDWTWVSSNNELKLKRGVANSGDKVVISVLKDTDYIVENNEITFINEFEQGTRIFVTSFTNHDVLEVERSNNTISFDTVLLPGTIEYQTYTQLTSGRIALSKPTLSADYVWISLNGELLTPNVDYILEPNLKFARISRNLFTDDLVEVIVFNSDTTRSAFGYRIFKDMLNSVKYQRFDDSTTTVLAEPLKASDPRIVVVNGEVLSAPNALKNQPGVVYIDKERIEYLKKTGNTLSQLRRGTLGTGIAAEYPAGSKIRDFSSANNIPYKDETITTVAVSSGYTSASTIYPNSPGVVVESFSYNFNNNTAFPLGGQVTTVIGTGFREDVKVLVGDTECPTTYISETELTFITPEKPLGSYDLVVVNPARTEPFPVTQTSYVLPAAIIYVQLLLPYSPQPNPASEFGWYKRPFAEGGIPPEYWEAQDIEVFVGGRRLRKSPLEIFDDTLGPDSVEGNKFLEAEFAVNKNIGPYVRLTTPPPPGVKIVVQKRIGKTWVNPGQSLTDAQSDPARFVRARGVDLSE